MSFVLDIRVWSTETQINITLFLYSDVLTQFYATSLFVYALKIS